MSRAGAACWVLSDGKAGTEAQCLGLAEAIGLPFDVRRIARRAPASWVPAQAWAASGTLALRLAAHGAALRPPWPRLLIAAGRPGVGPAIALRRAAAGQTFVVQLQDPRVTPHLFDLVVAPEHDGLQGANVLPTTGALHRVTAASLAAARAQWRARFEPVSQPRVAVLVGGSSRHHRMTEAAAARLSEHLRALYQAEGAGLLVTASRRTDPASRAALVGGLAGVRAEVWDGTGANPYQGMLAWADGIVVTEDSVTMASEAASTGKPVFVSKMEGGAAKFDRFHRALRERGISRPFDGSWATWSYPPINETARVAGIIKAALAVPGP